MSEYFGLDFVAYACWTLMDILKTMKFFENLGRLML